MKKCSHCGCELTEDNCSYQDFTCDDCFEDQVDDELSEDEEDEE